MIDPKTYTQKLIRACQTVFGERLLYVGLQGSYLRGEATEDSDIDIMTVLDGFTVEDMDAYRAILTEIGDADKACGFICGKDEIMHWNPLEVCQLRHTTKDLYGVLSDLLPDATREDEVRYVQICLGNLYHELCHRYIYADRAKNRSAFRRTCKSLLFLVQNLHYLESGVFALTGCELAKSVSAEDRAMLLMSALPDDFDFDSSFRTVFQWCQNAFMRLH